MTSPAQTSAEPGQSKPRERLPNGLFKTGLIGAGALTVTWWVLIACGVWRAMEWAGI
ncbi:hypothetical protein MGN01_25350 [Methylobacterium gnaphalii]|uniref:Uncharacterized protein n=1 Tax=Methylobacterium gnaphalii TaxID=1010610 RepID=A0A512JL65_9HYPH|nr:hypothetical protein MGN01_25350 [Methylobacterium gnaphalii]GLS47282.1 hypothetical protein GCM10007885_01260 [Methylobacterium gnaphalii]